MRLAIVSDLHLGDPVCSLAAIDPRYDKVLINEIYMDKFKKATRGEDKNGKNGEENDYLILLGDIFDPSVVGYTEAYRVGQLFFKKVKEFNIAKEVIYIPGNHDFDMWHICEYEVNVINRLKEGEPARPFKWSVPAIIDDRTDSDGNKKGKFYLHGVTPKESSDEKNRYGGLYLDKIAGKNDRDQIIFNFAYPNLYLMTDQAKVLVTHGHYFKPYWSLFGRITPKIFLEDYKRGEELTLKDYVAINFPLCQLASSGTGQAGPLTERIEFIQRAAKAGPKAGDGLGKLDQYIDRVDDMIDKMTDYWAIDPREIITDAIANTLKKKIKKELRKHKPDQFNCSWMKKKNVIEAFQIFYDYTLKEITEINTSIQQSNERIVEPDTMIYGHTHCPLGWGKDSEKFEIFCGNGNMIRVYNAGGWIFKRHITGTQEYYKSSDEKKPVVGAEVFLYSSENGFSSRRVLIE